MKIAFRIFISLLLVGIIYFFFFVAKSVDKSRNTTDLTSLPDVSAKARELHNTLTIADWHADPLLWDRNLLNRMNYGHIDIPRLIEGNVTLQVFAAVTKSPSGQNIKSNESNTFDNITPLVIGNRWPLNTWFNLTDRALYQGKKLYRIEEKSKGKFSVVTSRETLEELVRNHKNNSNITGGILGLEGLHALVGDIANLDKLYDRGYRIFGMAHFFDNKAGGSSAGISKGGLTDFGKEVIDKINEKSCLIDLAHASPKLISDVLEYTTRPVVVSHTGAKGVVNSPRNLSDEHIRRIAEKGGMIGIGFWSGAAGDISPEGIVKSIRYTVNLAGIDHVSLGSDFDGSVHTNFDVSMLVLITEALLNNGFSDEEIRKIMGGNQIQFLMKYLPEK